MVIFYNILWQHLRTFTHRMDTFQTANWSKVFIFIQPRSIVLQTSNLPAGTNASSSPDGWCRTNVGPSPSGNNLPSSERLQDVAPGQSPPTVVHLSSQCAVQTCLQVHFPALLSQICATAGVLIQTFLCYVFIVHLVCKGLYVGQTFSSRINVRKSETRQVACDQTRREQKSKYFITQTSEHLII